jgi:hypothetical protein
VRSRLVSFLAAALVAGAFAGGAAPAGVAQTSGCVDPLYCPQETPSVGPTGGLTKAQLLKKCKAKAQSKFGDNRPKKKAAIKKCKKKYG